MENKFPGAEKLGGENVWARSTYQILALFLTIPFLPNIT
jgi:hypothetical protein